jgi:hypothetical protein
MTKKFIIATAILLVAMEVVKRLSLSVGDVDLVYKLLYFGFIYYIIFKNCRRLLKNAAVAVIGFGAIAGVLLWAMQIPGVGLAIWLSGLFLSLWSDRNAVVQN